jgi:hypothetical protein
MLRLAAVKNDLQKEILISQEKAKVTCIKANEKLAEVEVNIFFSFNYINSSYPNRIIYFLRSILLLNYMIF